MYHTKDTAHEARDYFVQDVGYVFLREDSFDGGGNIVLTEYAELIEVKSVPLPSAIILFVAGMLAMFGYVRNGKLRRFKRVEITAA